MDSDRTWPYGDRESPNVLKRPVPYNSGEGAIYSIEYLIRRESNGYGTSPYDPRGSLILHLNDQGERETAARVREAREAP